MASTGKVMADQPGLVLAVRAVSTIAADAVGDGTAEELGVAVGWAEEELVVGVGDEPFTGGFGTVPPDDALVLGALDAGVDRCELDADVVGGAGGWITGCDGFGTNPRC